MANLAFLNDEQAFNNVNDEIRPDNLPLSYRDTKNIRIKRSASPTTPEVPGPTYELTNYSPNQNSSTNNVRVTFISRDSLALERNILPETESYQKSFSAKNIHEFPTFLQEHLSHSYGLVML